MPITADFHMHTHHSEDSDAPMKDMIESALQKGLTEICFTEHMDLDFPCTESSTGKWELNTDSYLYELLAMRELYKDKINIRFGVEMGLQLSCLRENLIYARSYDFDFIIGSMHLLNGKDPYYRDHFSELTDEALYREYFKATLANIKKCSNFDVLGHLDYVVRYGYEKDNHYSYDAYKDVLDPILEYLVENEKGLEVNSAGLRKGLKYPNPCIDVLKKYRDLGGEIITIGSDAHNPEDIAADFDKVSSLLTEVGFRYYATFQNRLPEYHRI